MRPRLDYQIIINLKNSGGLAVISIKGQTIALAGKTILWVASEGECTLKAILRFKIGNFRNIGGAWKTSPGWSITTGLYRKVKIYCGLTIAGPG